MVINQTQDVMIKMWYFTFLYQKRKKNHPSAESFEKKWSSFFWFCFFLILEIIINKLFDWSKITIVCCFKTKSSALTIKVIFTIYPLCLLWSKIMEEEDPPVFFKKNNFFFLKNDWDSIRKLGGGALEEGEGGLRLQGRRWGWGLEEEKM